jgi:3-hydroxyisobutyrate dehydrogenase-like beta-hydroxyacid dehydrogenase
MKGPSMAAGKFDPAFPLKHQQKDMRLALELGCAAVTFYLFCCKCFW